MASRLAASLLVWLALGCQAGAGERPAPASPAPPASAGEPAAAAEPVPPSTVTAAVAPAPAAMPGPADAGDCPEKDDPAFGVLVAPNRPAVGQPMQIL
ncbi:MAG TPA: hypothetical protein VGB85_05830, partial [Nannocystis sp.]